MGAPLNRSLAATLVAGVIGSGALLGGGAAVHRDPAPVDASVDASADPSEATMPFALEECDLGGGRIGHRYGTICSFAPPAGWVEPVEPGR
jgi:hypothetical protein